MRGAPPLATDRLAPRIAAAEGEAEWRGLALSLLTCPIPYYPQPRPKAALQLPSNDQDPGDILVLAVLF